MTTKPLNALSARLGKLEQEKTLAGTWIGTSQASSSEIPTEALPHKGNPWPGQVTLRVTSRGNALVHEMWNPQLPDDPTRYDHPTTVIYLDGDRLVLTHYCDMGNRPHMVGIPSPTGDAVSFDMVEVSGPLMAGYMNHVVFTQNGRDRHTEDWTATVGGKIAKFHIEMQRKQDGPAAARRP